MNQQGVISSPFSGVISNVEAEVGTESTQTFCTIYDKSEVKTAVLGDRTITVKNLTPVFSPQEQDKQSREVERRLFDVFRKYAGQRG